MSDTPPDVSTAGHGPSSGYSKMNDHLKNYFRKRGTLAQKAHQKRLDAAFSRDRHKKVKV